MINIYEIYLIMIRFYRSHGFEVFSTIDNETLLPEETIIEFKCDYLVKVNVKRLQRQLDKHIKSVKNYFIVVEESKIIVVIQFNQTKIIFGTEMEFSLN